MSDGLTFAEAVKAVAAPVQLRSYHMPGEEPDSDEDDLLLCEPLLLPLTKAIDTLHAEIGKYRHELYKRRVDRQVHDALFAAALHLVNVIRVTPRPLFVRSKNHDES